jgi:gluconate 2-dehydrogenase gamma chain
MAGQSLQRREILRIMGVAAVASHFPGFVTWSYAEGHAHPAGMPAPPEKYLPLFFSAPEFAVITKLSELIIPTDETPGAREAGVCEFVDFTVAHDVAAQKPMRAGLVWLEERSTKEFERAFLELKEPQQVSILDTLAFKAKHRAGEEVGQVFFGRIRDLTVMGFYSSEVGYKELDNPALHSWGLSPACPHTNDRAHVHLPPPKWAP